MPDLYVLDTSASSATFASEALLNQQSFLLSIAEMARITYESESELGCALITVFVEMITRLFSPQLEHTIQPLRAG